MNGITIKADSSGNISLEMGVGASIDKRCKPGKFYVYTHKDKDGKVFYVGKGTGDRAQSQERSPEWIEYLDKRSDGKFSVEIVRDRISEEDALEIEDADHENAQWNDHQSSESARATRFHEVSCVLRSPKTLWCYSAARNRFPERERI